MLDTRTHLDRAEYAIRSSDDEIATLERQLEAQRQLRAQRVEARDALRVALAEAEAGWAAIPDPAEELDQVRARIEASSEVDAAIEPWRAWDRSRAELEEATRAVDALTEVMGQLEVRERDLVHSAGIPLPGLSFADDGALLLNDLPLEVASGAERIELAVRVALEVDPELGIALIEEANDVDLEGLEKLDALAREHGFQLWAARLGLEGDGEVVVEDGVARERVAEEVSV